MTQRNAAMVEESRAGAHRLQEQAVELERVVDSLRGDAQNTTADARRLMAAE